ncbi:MAG: hypothetical protein Kow0031_36540 [Anaerolineae bacterium]
MLPIKGHVILGILNVKFVKQPALAYIVWLAHWHPDMDSTLTAKPPQNITVLTSRYPQLAGVIPLLEAGGHRVSHALSGSLPLPLLFNTDTLIIDITTARQPKSTQYIRVPTLIVLSPDDTDQLPPWLQAGHVFLVPLHQNPETLLAQIFDCLPPRLPGSTPSIHNPQHLTLLFGITQLLSGHLELTTLLERILGLMPYFGAEFGAILLQENQTGLYYRSSQPGREELVGPAGKRFAARLLSHGLEGWVLRHQQPALIANTSSDDRWLKAAYLPDVPQSVIALPINLNRVNTRGVLLTGRQLPGTLSREDDLPLLLAAITQIELALENAILFKNQSQRSEELALINEVSQAATSILNTEVMLRTVVQAIRRRFSFFSVAIYLNNPDSGLAELQAQASADIFGAEMPAAPPQPEGHAPNQGLVGWTLAHQTTALANDIRTDPRCDPTTLPAAIRAELCVPIVLGTKIVGVLNFRCTRLDAFESYHVSAMETLADQLAIAIENARLYDAINRRIDELDSLNQIGQAITSTLDLQKTLTLITDHTIRLMDVAAASVALIDADKNDVWFAAASGEGSEAVLGLRMARGSGIAGWVADQGESVIVPDVQSDSRFFAGMDRQSGFYTRSILCVPLQTKEGTIGAIEVMNKRVGTFNQEDMRLLQALAAPAATAIEHARLYEEKTATIRRLAETQTQLIQSAKLAAVGELAAGVAHEINNPLTSILGLTSLLLETPPNEPLDEPGREDLKIIHRESQRARDIVRGLLNFARADLPNRRPTDFSQLVDEAIFLVFTKRVSHAIELDKNLADLPSILVDPGQIKQVIVNLLNNAVQSMLPENGRPARLSVTTAVEPDETGLPCVICHVADTGNGIEPEILPKIFDPFFTTKEVGQGTGLGLSVSYGIIQRHGGSISVSSVPGQGTTFTISLPLPANPPARAAESVH